MGYPPTDYLGYTIKTKDRKVFKHKGVGLIFETREDATKWIAFQTREYDEGWATMSADERLALEGCEIINVEGNL